MKSEIKPIDDKTESLLISAAYKDCSVFERIKVKRILSKNPDLKELFERYRSTAEKVENLTEEKYNNTEYINNYLLPKMNFENENSLSKAISFVYRKPAVSAAFAAFVAVVITLSIVFNKPLNNSGYSREEVELANMQVKQSFAIIGNVFNRTQNTIEEEVLSKRVAKPINEGITTVNNLFSTGGKNEK